MNKYYSINLNNHNHWIAINGDESKPLLLILHGGPGTPCMSFFRKWNQPLEKDFLVVTWDQRGTGRSYYKGMDLTTLTTNQIVADTHQLCDYLKSTYNVDKIYLMGHSFGATVGLKVIDEKPENYFAYFGISQFINATLNEASCYKWLKDEATSRHDQKALKLLKSIGQPVDGFYTGGLKDTMKAKQLTTKYKGDSRRGSSSLALIKILLFSKEYGYHRFFNAIKGMQVSLSTIGHSLKDIDYSTTIPEVKIPVYFFSGSYDQLTPQHLLKDYFKQLKAPKKELIEFNDSAHNLLWEEGEKFHKTIHDIMNS